MTDVVDLDAFRARRAAVAEPRVEPIARLSLDVGAGEVDLEIGGVVYGLSPDAAELMGEGLIRFAARLRVRQECDEDDARRAHVPLADRRGRVLPPLKLRGWAIEVVGGSPTSSDPRWCRMTRPMPTRVDAERARRDYHGYGYAPDRVRVVPVDHRGRVIPPERMPTEAR